MTTENKPAGATTENTQTTAPFMATDNSSPSAENPNPVAIMEMENGDVVKMELYPAKAPESVRNFIHLSNDGFYDGLIFHRVIDGFMIQGGCPDGTGVGGPGWRIRGEFSGNGFENDIKHTDGVLSMARSGDPNSAGSQFFIMVAPSPHLDGQYAAFGKVISGMSAVYAMGKLPTGMRDRPLEPPKIKKIRVDTNGVVYDEPEKLR
jgi:peptidyl-prolyl cis-trans isomerase B (cyclophilin B)